MAYVKRTLIDISGFNMSFIVDRNQYLATFRQQHFLKEGYPTSHNKVFMAQLDASFQVLDVEELETIAYPTFESFTSGLEDARLIDEHSMTCVALDVNPDWSPQVCFCELSQRKITKVIPLFLDGERQPEKNWLLLEQKCETDSLYMIHSYDPMKILRVNKTTGLGEVVHMQKFFELEKNCEVHGGAVVYLEDKNMYLIVVRLLKNSRYYGSIWIQMSTLFKVLSISEPFWFADWREYHPPHLIYEMCVSLVRQEKKLFASVSLGDTYQYIYEFSLEDVLAK